MILNNFFNKSWKLVLILFLISILNSGCVNMIMSHLYGACNHPIKLTKMVYFTDSLNLTEPPNILAKQKCYVNIQKEDTISYLKYFIFTNNRSYSLKSYYTKDHNDFINRDTLVEPSESFYECRNNGIVRGAYKIKDNNISLSISHCGGGRQELLNGYMLNDRTLIIDTEKYIALDKVVLFFDDSRQSHKLLKKRTPYPY